MALPEQNGPPAPPPPSAFISHSSLDASTARELCTRLESRGVTCWIAPRDVTPGNPYADEIVRGIEGCTWLILLSTPNSISSDNVMNELEQAFRLHRAILTIMVKGATVSRQLGYYIARLHWIECTADNIDSVADRLSVVLHGQKPWERVASPPSISRRLRYALPSFAGASAAIVLAMIFLGVVGWYLWGRARRALAMDYRSVGWVSISSARLSTSGDSIAVAAQLWLGNANLPFGRTRFVAVAQQSSGQVARFDMSQSMDPADTGEQPVTITIPVSTTNLSTRFAVPSLELQREICVQQKFNVTSQSREISVQQIGEPTTSLINASQPCN
jgi:TIR domain